MEVFVIKHEDLRIKKSKHKVKTAFINLMFQKNICDITITELTKKAQITRRTFYAHYAKVEDVMNDIENEIVEKITSTFCSYNFFSPSFEILNFLNDINKIVLEDIFLFEKIVLEKKYTYIIFNIKNQFKNSLIRHYPHYNLENQHFIHCFCEAISSSLTALYYNWIEHNDDMDIYELVEHACPIFKHQLNLAFY